MSEKNIDIVGLGASTLDFLSIVDHFPAAEEVQKAICNKIEGGGPVSTALVAASRLGLKTVMLDSFGNDLIGKILLEGLIKEGVSAEFIKINPENSSPVANVFVRKSDGARTIIYSPGNSPELNEKDIPVEVIQQAKFLHINGRHFRACKYACEIAVRSNTLISFDGGSHRFREEHKEIVPLADICIISKDFAFRYTGDDNIENALKILSGNKASVIVITDGVNGSWLYSADIYSYHQKAFIMPDVVDTTGCGDCFHGAFLYGLTKGKGIKETIKIASAAAALNTRQLGGRSALPDEAELMRFIQNKSYTL